MTVNFLSSEEEPMITIPGGAKEGIASIRNEAGRNSVSKYCEIHNFLTTESETLL